MEDYVPWRSFTAQQAQQAQQALALAASVGYLCLKMGCIHKNHGDGVNDCS